ncbi:ATP-binding protein [Streptomyces sp. NPDC006704]|uniref:ATP-binding protein n=1 Tax=Streptomyces sp. NPDC006704 TaxID=3364760 RepID=UPI00368FD78D
MDRPRRELSDRRPLETGKSHFTEDLAQAAIEKDLRVSWFTLETLSAAVGKSKVDGSPTRTVARICRADLIVIDDIGQLPVGRGRCRGVLPDHRCRL